MALVFLLPSLTFTLLLFPPPTQSHLTLDYYNKTCPQFSHIMTEIITEKQMDAPTTAAGTLRLFFHDCMAGGCDASVLVTSNSFNTAQRDADDNLSLPGDAFELITRAKTALELQCPGVVSCADILAVAARDLVTMVGGPHYQVELGRKDAVVSKASEVEGHIGRPNMTVTQLISMFESKGLSIQELVALSGAHTIGFSHCDQFACRLYNFSRASEFDPTYNPEFARALQKLCANYTQDATMSAFNDVMTPGKFDNMYYRNLQNGLGLLGSDQALVSDPRTKGYVDLYAANQTAFFHDFARTMEKVSLYEVRTGDDGEVRRRCDAFNTLNIDHGSDQKTQN